MKNYAMITLLAAFTAVSLPLSAETTKTTNVEHGVPTTHIYESDSPAVGDPVQGKSNVGTRDDRGPTNTQKYCEEGSTDPDCTRAAKRQTSPTTWEQDCASGATHACPGKSDNSGKSDSTSNSGSSVKSDL